MPLGRSQPWEVPVLAGSAALLIAFSEIILWVPDGALGAVWPGIALLLGLLLGWGDRRSRIAALAGGAALGLGVAALVNRTGATIGLLHGIGTLGAALLAFRRLGGEARPPNLFERMGGLNGFARAAAAAALVPAGLEWALSGWRQGLADYGAVLLFVALAGPAVALAVQVPGRSDGPTRQADRLRSAATLALGAGIATLVFAAGPFPLSFLVPAAVLLATWRLGASGGALMAATVALVAIRAGNMGAGPIALAPASPAVRFALQQALLACCFVAGLPIALLIRARAGDAGLAQRLRTVVETNGDVLFLLDGQGRWAYLNPAWQALSGLPPEQSLGRSWLEQVDAEDRDLLDRQASALLSEGAGAFHHTLRFHAPGGLRWVELFLKPVIDANGCPAGAAGSLRDVDERKRLEEHTLTARRVAEQRAREATLLASTDELTGIANRRAFLHQLDREIEAAREHGWPLAVALFDVDHFKAVNDRFGHAVGDRVLQHIAARAVASVRGGDLVGRLGGEEFGILMPGSSAAEAAIVAERLRRAVQAPAVDGQALPSVTVSIGIAQREDQRAAETLLATADLALYRAKDEGRNRIRIAA